MQLLFDSFYSAHCQLEYKEYGRKGGAHFTFCSAAIGKLIESNFIQNGIYFSSPEKRPKSGGERRNGWVEKEGTHTGA